MSGHGFDQVARDVETEAVLLTVVAAYFGVRKVNDNRQVARVDHDVRSDHRAQRRRHLEERLPPVLQLGQQVDVERLPVGFHVVEPRQPVGLVLLEVGALIVEDGLDLSVRHRVGRGNRVTDLNRGAGDVHHAITFAVVEHRKKCGLVGEDRQLVTVDHVQAEQVRVEETGWAGAGHNRACVDFFDVPHRTGELGIDLGCALVLLLCIVHLIDHRIPDRARELQPVKIDRTVRSELTEVVRAAVVLVDEDRIVGNDDKR